MAADIWLCADIGGTKTLLGLARREGAQLRITRCDTFAAAELSGFEEALDRFLASCDHPPVTAACLGVAGPVDGDHVRMTNLSWDIHARDISARLGGVPTRLANDLEATAAGIDAVTPDQLTVLQDGRRLEHAPQLVVAAGTGLGIASRIWNGRHYQVVPGECGHMNWAPPTAAFDALLPHLRHAAGGDRLTNEHVVSGIGLPHLYAAVAADMGEAAPSQPVHGPELAERARAGEAVAQRVVALFLTAYGSLAGDHALAVLARGGVFIAGGIAQKWVAAMQDGRFIEAFRAKPPYAHIAASLPVHVVTEPALPLMGAAVLAERLTQAG